MKVVGFGKGFSGMMDGIVYYEMNGKLYARLSLLRAGEDGTAYSPSAHFAVTVEPLP